MSTNKDLFKEAIADAKAVREAALTNAKAALEEALTPKLQSMIAAKLQEMDNNDEDEKLEEVDYISANDKSNDSDMIRKKAIDAGQMSESEELEEDFDLSAILAELDAEDSVNEAKDEDEEKEKIKEAEEEEAGEEEEVEDEESEMEPTEEPAEEETADEDGKITDLTVDQLKDIIKDIISSELEAEEYETEADEEAEMGGEEMGMEMGAEETADEDEINLEELLAELDALNEGEEKEEEELKEFVGTETADSGMIAALATLLGVGVPLAVGLVKQLKQAKTPAEKKQVIQNELPGNSEMKEAIDTINTLRNELNEVNLLNAKLLYVNKIFKAKNLNESQKLKVIAQFDKATTAQEAKTIFESMNNAIVKSTKSTIKESLGFASKAAGVAPQKQIVEVNETVSRWQMLAGIK